jgi:hypothetical protein
VDLGRGAGLGEVEHAGRAGEAAHAEPPAGDGDEDDNLPLDALRLHVVDKRDASRRRLPLYARWLDWLHGCLDRYRPAALEIHSDFDMTVDLRLMGLRSDLSRLNTLRLQGVLHAGGFGDDSVSVCPKLEHVEFTSCAIGFEGVVTARTLKTLVIDRCWRRDDTKEEGAPRPRVQAPALASLRLVMSFQSDIWVFQTPSLVEASIRSTRSFVNRDDEYELLCNLYNVTRLELSGFLPLDKVWFYGDLLSLLRNLDIHLYFILETLHSDQPRIWH